MTLISPKFRVQQWMTFARTWWLYDAKWQCAMKSSERMCVYLEGRHKPIYSPLSKILDLLHCYN